MTTTMSNLQQVLLINAINQPRNFNNILCSPLVHHFVKSSINLFSSRFSISNMRIYLDHTVIENANKLNIEKVIR